MKTFRKLRQKRAGSQVRPPLSRRQVLAGLMAGIAAGPAWAGPQGMTVQAGTVSAARTGANLDITASHNAVINWASFNIGAGETTTFHQPSAVSVVWNRILDANPSQIWGSLNGNGIVVLMNQNGFYFGPGSSVNVGGFIALAAPIAPASPAGGGLWQYQGPPPAATIINYGEVRAKSGGSLFMVAEHIENHGVLAAPGGTVGLYAGKEVLLSERPDGRGLSMNVQLPHGSVDNTGQVIADAGTIAVHARVVNQQGLVQANSVREANGTIELIATDQINLGANCVLEAKGDAQGISAGGQITLKSSGGFADAPGSSINVSGGAQGGNGGAVELSALSFSKINSRIEGSALPGWQGGQLLLDPYDITLSGADDTDSTPSQTVNFSDAPGLSLRLNVNSAFYGFSQITLQATHDILFESGTVWDLNGSTGIGDPGSLLRLEAGNNIVFGDNSRVVAGTGWSVHLAAGVDFSSPSLALRPGIGGIYLNGLTGGSGAIEAFDGEIQLRAGHEVLVGAGFIRTWGGGNIAITTLDGDVDAGTKNDGYQFGRTGPVTVGLDPDTRQPSYTWIGGIGTALGGDVSILAGRDILASSAPIGAFGIGNVNATAGRDILGQFILRKGVGTLHAGRDVGTELSGVSLALSQGGWQVTAGWDPGTGQAVAGRGDLFLDEIYNVNGSLNPNRLLTGARRAFQFDYGQDAFASLTAGNSVQLLGDSIAHAAGNSDRQVIYPPCLSIEAGPGGVVLGNDVILYPSPLGSLSIKTTGGGSLRSREGGYAQFILSDSDSPDYETFAEQHAAVPLHLNSGDKGVTLDISGNLENVALRSPRSADITVHGNAVNFSLEVQNLSVDDTTKLHIDGDYTSRLSVTAVTLADVPNLDIFTDPLQMVNTRLGPLLSYNPLTHQLQYRGRMTQQDLYDLLNPQVYVVDLLTQCPVLDVNGLPVMRPVQLTTDIAAINNLFTASQDVPVSPLAYNGLQIGGPGKFDFMARNLDLGASAGIRSVAFLLNPSLAGVSLRGADLSVKLWGDLQMGSSQIASFGGGSIDVTAAGKMDIGSQEQYSGDDTPKGIYTAYGGHVSVEAGGNINVNGSRIASYDGGDVTVTSDGGSIDAGQGAKGFFYVATPQLDPQTKLPQVPPPNDRFFGSGIMALTRPGASSDAKVGNIKVTAAGDISANSSGVLQLAFNNVDQNGASLLLDAGKNIQANQSGVLGYNVKLNAKGNITGLVVAQQNLVVDAVKSVAVTALASGNASISGESVSGKVVAAGGIGVSGQQEGSLTVISASSPGGSGSTGGAFANVAAPAAPAKATETADKTLAAQPDSKSADEDPLLKNKKKAQLVRTVSRVTVILPKK